MKTHLFQVTRVSKNIPAKYKGQLAYFFDDHHDNPLRLPKGMTDVSADDTAKQLAVVYDPSMISLKRIQTYLASTGLTTKPLSEKKRTAGETVLTIALYPLLLIIGAIVWTIYQTHRLVARRKHP